MPTIEDRFLLRGGLKAAMVSLNEVPLRRELIVELDNLWTTGELDAKIGDGTTHYVDLPYLYVTAPLDTVLGSPVTALTIVSGVVNIDCSLGDYFTLALTANVTSLTFSNAPTAGSGRTISVTITQDSTGARTFALPASFKAIAGSDAAIQAAANAVTKLMIETVDIGTTWAYVMKGRA
jgi:hypothetical protein